MFEKESRETPQNFYLIKQPIEKMKIEIEIPGFYLETKKVLFLKNI